jgi:hypothetical protein
MPIVGWRACQVAPASAVDDADVDDRVFALDLGDAGDRVLDDDVDDDDHAHDGGEELVEGEAVPDVGEDGFEDELDPWRNADGRGERHGDTGDVVRAPCI